MIYRTSNPLYEQGYHKVFDAFPHVQFVKQGPNPGVDFKPLTINATFKSPNEYVIFAVDDIIVTDYVDVSECIAMLERTHAYGFYLRMAPHLIQSYLPQHKQPVPSFIQITDTILSWEFSEGHIDWAYPHTVDMTLYRKNHIRKTFIRKNLCSQHDIT